MGRSGRPWRTLSWARRLGSGGKGGGQCGDAAENLPGNTRREEFCGMFPRHQIPPPADSAWVRLRILLLTITPYRGNDHVGAVLANADAPGRFG